MDDDRALVEELQRGSAGAFRRFHRAYGPRSFAYLLRLTKDVAEAEDAFQETWLRCARAVGGLSVDTPLRPYVLAVARSAFIDGRRRQRRVPFPAGDELPEPTDPAPPLDALLADRQALAALEEALNSLDVGARELLHATAIEGLSAREVADLLGISPEAARKRLERARGDLARALARRSRP